MIGWLLISAAYLGTFQANFFDGKSDGKNLLGILLQKFTVRNICRRQAARKSMDKSGFRNWKWWGLGNPRVLSLTFSHAATAGCARQAFLRSAQFGAFRCFGLPNRFEKNLLRRAASEPGIRQQAATGLNRSRGKGVFAWGWRCG